MEKRRLLNKLASAFGRKATEPTEPAPPEAEPIQPSASAPSEAPAAEPPEAAAAEPSGEAEPQPLGNIMAPIDPEIADDERLAQSLDDAVAVTERAGRMLEAQAKQQQQVTDVMAELSEMVRDLNDRGAADGEALETIRTQLIRSGEVTERLAEQFDDAVAKLAMAGGDSARLGENLATLTRTIEQISGSVAEQGRNQRNAMAELNKQLGKSFAGLRWLLLAAVLLAAVAVAAPFVAKWF